ncbi:hypothetical protein ACE1OA_14440 [Streptomyces sp. JL2001]|uniref:hypothetical protein n=1 Tax=Streptomyces sp. JL2001 TaxID=3342488 RepID=UPI003D8049BC
MSREPGGSRREQMVDWLETHPDLPHLFARISELVHVAGFAPEDLVVLPRSEVDRRETAAFTSGWAEAVSDELPRIRREYEKRVADAYAQGQSDARGIRRPLRRSDVGVGVGGDGARVIPLPFARLLEPPAAVIQAEERVRRERELFERRPEPPSEPAQPTVPAPRSGQDDESAPEPGPGSEVASAPYREPVQGLEQDVLPSAQESRTRRSAQPVRKVVRGKGGRPIVPPLAGAPAPGGAASERRGHESGDPDGRGRGRRLSERARALEEDLAAERAQEAPPEPGP